MNKHRLPAEVSHRLIALAQRLRVARQRRRWTIAETAGKAGINRNTLGALERGKPGVTIGTYAALLWVLDLDRSLDAVADLDQDVQGKALEAARLPLRVRKGRPHT